VPHVGPAVWKSFSVDGETYYWTAHASEQRAGDGAWEPIEYLTVSRRADSPGIGAAHPAGTLVTEQHAVDLVRLAKAHGRDFP
jgi:hypothetical protein